MRINNTVFNSEWKVKVTLFFITAIIYTLYFHTIFFSINSLLSSITSDTIKNYYTYVYHIRHDHSALHFSGMAYPYGEHVVYTDCQPILTFILRLLPFTHNHLIGILHGLIFLSFIITPVILYSTLRLTNTGKFTSFFVALGIGLLSPQFLKINAGHHGLAYAFVIPVSIFLTLKYLKDFKLKTLILIFLYHCLLFLLHPYHGFSVCIFFFMIIVFAQLIKSGAVGLRKAILWASVAGIGPVALFKFFMLLTDHHPNRTTEPYGLNMMIENLDSLLAPVFGPMKGVMESFFNNRVNHYEGHTYLGLTSILMVFVLIILIPFYFKKIKVKPELAAILSASFVLLLISFGFHYNLFHWLGLNHAFMNQFRATCRFAWFFYYALPLFLIPTFYHTLKNTALTKIKPLMYALPVLFACINLGEAHFMFKMDEDIFWKFRNFFNASLLNGEEKKVLSELQKEPTQAIVPLPVFHSGSEMYDRKGFNYSMIPSMLYSSHSGIPVFSVLMSRTSITETENSLNLLNSYIKNSPAQKLLNNFRWMVLKTEREIMPDEERLWKRVSVFCKNDSTETGFISARDFSAKKTDGSLVEINSENKQWPDSNNVVLIPFENRTPFTDTKMNQPAVVYSLDSNKVVSGKYIVSSYFYYNEKNYHSLACDMVVTETSKDNFVWKYMLPFRFLSGFYSGYGVMEAGIEIEKNKKYEFVIMGREELTYKLSDFMLRPSHLNIMYTNGKDTVYNNFRRK